MKIIKVTCCGDCPFNGKCEAWKALSAKERVYLNIGNRVPKDMILKTCKLEDSPMQ